MTASEDKRPEASEIDEAARIERHPEVPEHAPDERHPAVPGGDRPDAAVAEDPAHPGMIDTSKT